MKRCAKCKQYLDINMFCRNKSRKDGFNTYCKKCSNSNFSKWRINNIEKDRNRKIQWRNLNLEYDKKRKAEWSSSNLDRRRLSAAKRRLLEKSVSFYISKKDMKRLTLSCCFYCGSKNKITIDHVIPLSRGGSHGIGNLVPACVSCNSSKCDKYLIEWKRQKNIA